MRPCLGTAGRGKDPSAGTTGNENGVLRSTLEETREVLGDRPALVFRSPDLRLDVSAVAIEIGISRTQPANMHSSETRSSRPWASRRRCQGRQAEPSAVVADSQTVQTREQRRPWGRIENVLNQAALSHGRRRPGAGPGDQPMWPLARSAEQRPGDVCAATGDQLRIRILGTFSRAHELLRTVAG